MLCCTKEALERKGKFSSDLNTIYTVYEESNAILYAMPYHC